MIATSQLTSLCEEAGAANDSLVRLLFKMERIRCFKCQVR